MQISTVVRSATFLMCAAAASAAALMAITCLPETRSAATTAYALVPQNAAPSDEETSMPQRRRRVDSLRAAAQSNIPVSGNLAGPRQPVAKCVVIMRRRPMSLTA